MGQWDGRWAQGQSLFDLPFLPFSTRLGGICTSIGPSEPASGSQLRGRTWIDCHFATLSDSWVELIKARSVCVRVGLSGSCFQVAARTTDYPYA